MSVSCPDCGDLAPQTDMSLPDELQRSVFGDKKVAVLEAGDDEQAIHVRQYQLALLQKAVHQNVRLPRSRAVLTQNAARSVLGSRGLIYSNANSRADHCAHAFETCSVACFCKLCAWSCVTARGPSRAVLRQARHRPAGRKENSPVLQSPVLQH